MDRSVERGRHRPSTPLGNDPRRPRCGAPADHPLWWLAATPVRNSWPTALEAAEVIVAGRSWGAVIGIYGMLVDAQGERVGSGRISVPLMLEEVAPIVRGSSQRRGGRRFQYLAKR